MTYLLLLLSLMYADVSIDAGIVGGYKAPKRYQQPIVGTYQPPKRYR